MSRALPSVRSVLLGRSRRATVVALTLAVVVSLAAVAFAASPFRRVDVLLFGRLTVWWVVLVGLLLLAFAEAVRNGGFLATVALAFAAVFSVLVVNAPVGGGVPSLGESVAFAAPFAATVGSALGATLFAVGRAVAAAGRLVRRRPRHDGATGDRGGTDIRSR
ncbi:hypothetical protein ACFO0N_11550 [Halobium salinum]|uniref:Uncharacterized protein n=1 Tax=Halobium salinum TaxID=1364940 RepID=A0ABD5PCT2_9EURY|nr:hypothetical protein [Halobium salinum]